MPKSMHDIQKSRNLARVIKLTLMVVMSVVAVARAAVWFANAQSLPADAQATCTVTAPLFASWFETGAVSLNGVVKPADSVNFPNIPNCRFYQWSEQMFLWLTSPAPAIYGGGGERIFSSPAFYDVSPTDASDNRTFIPHTPGVIRNLNLRVSQSGAHGLPIIKDRRGRIFEVEQPRIASSGKQLILNRSGRLVEIESSRLDANRKPIFLDKAGKMIPKPKPIIRPELAETPTVQKFIINKIPIFFDWFGNVIDTEEGQAGGGEALLAQNGSLVYYTTTVNDVFAYFLTGAKNGGITPMPTKFPTTQADLNKVIAFASAHGKTFPDPNALAVEVKSSWVEAAGLPYLSSYITMQGTIPTYDKSDPNRWAPTGHKTALLALVGMHVVGSVKGHPEMIWATFEHFDNAPKATYTYNAITGPNPKTIAQNTVGAWLFCASGAAGPFNVAHLKASAADLNSVSPFTISSSDTLRVNAWGNSAGASSAAKNTEIIAINNSVLGMLPSGDVRKNYMFTGATWTIGGASPSGGNEVGTNKMANSTMETYQQGTNCFNCHLSNSTSVSHVFDPLKPLFGAGPTSASVYTATIQPIWNLKCTGCHSGSGAPKGLNLTAGNSYSLLVDVNSNELPSMKRIKPNDVANSYLVHKVEGTQGAVGGSGGQMPLGCSGSSCLSAAQINDIKAWINLGPPPS
jgi:hypothetical protein